MVYIGLYTSLKQGFDNFGRPLTITRMGAIDIYRLLDITTFEELEKMEIQRYEYFTEILLPIVGFI